MPRVALQERDWKETVKLELYPSFFFFQIVLQSIKHKRKKYGTIEQLKVSERPFCTLEPQGGALCCLFC